MMDHPGLQLMEELLDVPSPTGWEARMARLVCDKLAGWGYAAQIDPAGNVYTLLEGRDPSAPLVCLCAHMDEIAITVETIHPDGTLSVHRSGGLFPEKAGEGPFEFLGDEHSVTGVLAMGSGHAAQSTQKTTWADVRVITGLTPAQLKAAGVRPGTPGVPLRARRGPFLMGDPADPLVAGWTFDDRLGMVALLLALKELHQRGEKPYAPLAAAFTVSEEIGGQGARSLAARLRPEVFIAVDGCPITPGSGLVMDGRPGIRSQDGAGHYDQRLLRALCRAAEKAGTELQIAAYNLTASDASMVYEAGLAPRAGCLGQVRENSHGFEVASLATFDHLTQTLVRFMLDGE